jgi:hypothetical protein
MKKLYMTIALIFCDYLLKYLLTFTVGELLNDQENLSYYWGLISIEEIST